MTANTRSIDNVLVGAVLLLMILGTVMIYSSSAVFASTDYKSDSFFFQRQLIWLGVSCVVMLLVARLDYTILIRFAWPLIILSIALLVVVLFAREINYSTRWINLGPVNFQPSEFFKYALIIFLSALLAVKRERIKQLTDLLLPAAPIIIIGFALILLQPNLGTVLVLASAVIILFFIAGMRKRYLFGFIAGMGLISYIIVFLFGYKRPRIDAFLRSLEDPLMASYQIKQSVLAIGSGGFTGKGLGRGSAKLFYLPAPHTDFIFATIAEEGGFLLAMGVLVLIGIIVWRGIRTAVHAPDLAGFYLAIGVTSLIFCQAATNLMVATSLIPATGLPLPFVSYGGSSLVFAGVGIGLLLSVSRYSVATPQLFKSRAQ